ncbi:MAG: outer membrane protein assembly factor BamD [Thermodesulfobacteriota bacterium]
MNRAEPKHGPTVRTGILLLLLLPLLGGCAVWDNTLALFGLGRDYRPTTAEGLVMEAMDLYNFGKYDKAFQKFSEIGDNYPFSQHSMLAELKMADCKYYLKEYDTAAGLYAEFEDNHPTNEAIPYVMFQIGMCHFRKIDTIDRDPAGANDAIEAFNRLLRSYPVSPYTQEASDRIARARNFLAQHELYVANFYLRKEEFKQAERRLDYLIENYPESPVSEEGKTLLAAVRSDNPPRRTWRDWIPDISLPSWKNIKESVVLSPAGTGGGPAN